MKETIVLEVFTFEEAAALLNLKPDTIRKAIESVEMQARSEYPITGPALSEWWKSKEGDSVLLEDYIDRVQRETYPSR